MARFVGCLCAAAIALAPPSAASAQPQVFYNSGTTGTILSEICTKKFEPVRYDPCGSYLMGVIDGLGFSIVYCPPPEVKNRQLMQIAYKAVMDSPEEWHQPAVYLIERAFVRAFPCTNTPG